MGLVCQASPEILYSVAASPQPESRVSPGDAEQQVFDLRTEGYAARAPRFGPRPTPPLPGLEQLFPSQQNWSVSSALTGISMKSKGFCAGGPHLRQSVGAGARICCRHYAG